MNSEMITEQAEEVVAHEVLELSVESSIVSDEQLNEMASRCAWCTGD